MTVRFFKERLQDQYYENAKKRYNHTDGMVWEVIHRIGETAMWYVVFPDSDIVHEIHANGTKLRKLTIADLPGDDFETYNPFQIVGCGYLDVYDRTWFRRMPEAVDVIHTQILTLSDTDWMGYTIIDERYDERGLSAFTYTHYGLQITIRTAYSLVMMNTLRKACWKRVVPFKRKNFNQALHITFVRDMRDGQYRTAEEQMYAERIAIFEVLQEAGFRGYRYDPCEIEGFLYK